MSLISMFRILNRELKAEQVEDDGVFEEAVDGISNRELKGQKAEDAAWHRQIRHLK